MSARLLGLGFGCDMGTPCRKLILLKLIDACDDDGTRIFPAVSTIARAAQCSTRQVQRELALMVEKGLLAVVRAGGAGPKSTREYSMNLTVLRRIEAAGWDGLDGENKGDTESPLENKGDTGDTLRVTPATDKGDSHCHPTPPYPSPYPSDEREARERGCDSGSEGVDVAGDEPAEDPKAVDRAFKRVFPRWPTYVGDSEDAARKAWFDLVATERAEAADRISDYLAAAKAGGRKTVCSFGVYLSEKRWEKLPAREAEPENTDEFAAPFGKLWGAQRLVHLLEKPGPMPSPTSFIRKLIEQGGEAGQREKRQHLARHGWPRVNAMHGNAAERRGARVPVWMRPLGDLFSQVKVGGELWDAWRRAHEARGWPWMPDPGQQGFVWMPAGDDPESALRDFQAALRDVAREAGEAAE